MIIPARAKRGFSFIEITFTLLIIGVLMVPVLNIFSDGSHITVRSRNDVLALQHVSNLLAYAFTLPYDALLTQAVTIVNDVDVEISGEMVSLSMPEPIFTRTVKVTEVTPANWKYSYKLVEVTISWEESNDVNREIKMSGLVSR